MTDTLLGGRYRLDHLIGRGGMAAVWSATDTVLDRSVAIKRLHAGLLADEEHAERFRREAVLVARLSHPNLVRLLDRGEDPDGPYLVMELVDGENLRARIRREGPLDPDEAARICAEVGRALSYAHGQGVVHRDIKAQNVLLTAEGGVKLADFGIARLIETEGEPGLTKTDMLLGSADYLSPEQADGRPLDARTDIYSLGILLYECLTGVLPFRGEGFVAVAMKHCSEPMPDPRVLAPGVPEWLAACTLRATAKEPSARYPDADRMVAALEGKDPGTAVMPVVPLRRPGDPDEDTARRRRPAAAPLGRGGGGGPGGAAGRRVARGVPPAARRRLDAARGRQRAPHDLGRARLRPPGQRPGREPRPARVRRGRATPRPPGTPSATATARTSGRSRAAWGWCCASPRRPWPPRWW